MFYFNFIVNILILLYGIYLLYYMSECFRKNPPFVPTTGNAKKAALSKISALLSEAPNHQVVFDLGCGTGSMLRSLAKKFPEHQFIGIEKNPLLLKACKSKRSNLKFIKANMFEYDYSKANIIFYFGIPVATKKLEEIFIHQKINADVISLDEKFKSFPLVEKCCFRFLWGKFCIYHYKTKN